MNTKAFGTHATLMLKLQKKIEMTNMVLTNYFTQADAVFLLKLHNEINCIYQLSFPILYNYVVSCHYTVPSKRKHRFQHLKLHCHPSRLLLLIILKK